MRTWTIALALFALSPLPASAQSDCPGWGRFERAPSLKDPQINESSGLASSRLNPGSLWTHNDSGDSARLFLVGEDGATRATVQLEGIEARDWEDMSTGPCADGETPCLYVADIGDNLAVLDEVVVHRFPEPKIGEATTVRVVSEIETLRFQYADGSRDAEALMVHPSGRIFVADKVDGGIVQIYEVPARFGASDASPVVANVVATLNLEETNDYGNLITAGDFAPDGASAILKTYFFLYTFCGQSTDPVALFNAAPFKQNAPITQQGESLAWDALRPRIWITSERLPAPVFYMRRAESDAEPGDAGGLGSADAGPLVPRPDSGNQETTDDAEAPPVSDTRSGSEKEGCSAAGTQPTSLLFGAFLLLSLVLLQKRSRVWETS